MIKVPPRWLLLAGALLLACLPAGAFTCSSISSPGVFISYYNRTAAVAQGTFTVTCTRRRRDPNTLTYEVAVNDGLDPTPGGVNRAVLGSSRIRYDTYLDSNCSVPWSGTSRFADSMSWPGSSTGSTSKQGSFWICATGQNIAGAGGTYLDTVRMTLMPAGSASITGNINVEMYAPANCTFTTPPGNITLSYTAFGPQVTNSTTFGVQCTDGLPYTIATNVPEGVLVNLRYVLSLSQTSATGNGLTQNHTVTATVPAGQAGTCAAGTCSASQTHTIILTY